MKLALCASPVQVLTSTTSSDWLRRLRTDASWERTKDGAVGMLERWRGYEPELRAGGRVGRRSCMSCGCVFGLDQ